MRYTKEWKLEEENNFHAIDNTISWRIDASFFNGTGPLPEFERSYWLTVGVVDKRKCKSAEAALKYFKKTKLKKVSSYEVDYEE